MVGIELLKRMFNALIINYSFIKNNNIPLFNALNGVMIGAFSRNSLLRIENGPDRLTGSRVRAEKPFFFQKKILFLDHFFKILNRKG